MTRDEVLAMAEQAGGKLLEGVALYVGRYHISTQFLERFAALAFAAGQKTEREECAKDNVDAERYRWIKENSMAECINCVTPWKCNGPHVTGGDALDEQIDRARSAK